MVYLVIWCRGLPISTICTCKTIGVFGALVWRLTNAYHSLPTFDLIKTSGPCAFTKHHRLVITTDIIYCYNVLDELLMVGY